MAKCNKCNKKGLFFKVNNNGFCNECERINKLEQEEAYLIIQTEKLKNEYTDLDTSYNSLKENKKQLYLQIASKAKNDIFAKYDDVLKNTEDVQTRFTEAQDDLIKTEKSIVNAANKLAQVKTLLNSVKYSAQHYFDNPDCIKNEVLQEAETLLATTIKLKFNLMDIRELRRRYNQNNKIIQELLSKYQSRYTTKANISIYRLMVIALEAELQNILYNLKYSKLDKAIKDIKTMTAKYQKIATDGNQSISPTITKFIGEIEYLFIEAINIEYEYYIQKERIKEEQRAIREKMKQEAAEQKRLEEERIKVEKEEEKYRNELAEIERLISEEKDAIKLEQLEKRKNDRLEEIHNLEIKKDAIIKRAHGLAGSVYIISNLGSFGEDVFKVGMTRRLIPEERVIELGDASVPFRFDIHSIIFSQNAPELELKLHKQLHNKRVNKINLRKEFFRITIDELEELVYSIEPTAEFNKTMLAEQYYQSMAVNEIPESVNILDDSSMDDSDDDED